MATLSSPTWILRLPRIGPVVTLSSVRAGMSAIVRLLFLRRSQPDQVRWVTGSRPPLKRRSALPQGRVVLRTARRGSPPARRLFLARRGAGLGGRDHAVMVGVVAVEPGDL